MQYQLLNGLISWLLRCGEVCVLLFHRAVEQRATLQLLYLGAVKLKGHTKDSTFSKLKAIAQSYRVRIDV